jgi:hypothetical protein
MLAQVYDGFTKGEQNCILELVKFVENLLIHQQV